MRDDGYVVVLHADANGRVRVLFPVDPGDDNFMKGGQDYEIRGRGDKDAFQVTSTGAGTVYAAVSMDPMHFDDVRPQQPLGLRAAGKRFGLGERYRGAADEYRGTGG